MNTKILIHALVVLGILGAGFSHTTAAEVWATSGHGEIFAFDGSTGEKLVEIPYGWDQVDNAGGLGFRTRDNFWVAEQLDPAGEHELYSYSYTATDGWKRRNEFAPGTSSFSHGYGAAMWQGIFYVVGYSSHNLWAYSHVYQHPVGSGYLPTQA